MEILAATISDKRKMDRCKVINLLKIRLDSFDFDRSKNAVVLL
jgi:hypothetical protein